MYNKIFTITKEMTTWKDQIIKKKKRVEEATENMKGGEDPGPDNVTNKEVEMLNLK